MAQMSHNHLRFQAAAGYSTYRSTGSRPKAFQRRMRHPLTYSCRYRRRKAKPLDCLPNSPSCSRAGSPCNRTHCEASAQTPMCSNGATSGSWPFRGLCTLAGYGSRPDHRIGSLRLPRRQQESSLVALLDISQRRYSSSSLICSRPT